MGIVVEGFVERRSAQLEADLTFDDFQLDRTPFIHAAAFVQPAVMTKAELLEVLRDAVAILVMYTHENDRSDRLEAVMQGFDQLERMI